ncbi:MAG: hypothetical protein QFF03_11230 [Pseudomonadota bacterium]|nr:hypothetical protein [Pseudomonadota bacterium]
MRLAHLALMSATLFCRAIPARADAPAVAAAASTPQQQVDALFARWDRKDLPGCAVAVIRDGKRTCATPSHGWAASSR